MRARIGLQAAVFFVAVAGSGLDISGTEGPRLGVGAAEAKAYYTRKRVNGQWITGQFPKRVREAAPARTKVATRERERAVPERAAVLPSPPEPRAAAASASARKPSIAPPPLPSAAAEPRSVTFDFQSGRKTTVFTDGRSLTEPFDPAEVPSATSAVPSTAAATAAATAASAARATFPEPSPPLVPLAQDERLSALQRALEARAGAMAQGGGIAPKSP